MEQVSELKVSISKERSKINEIDAELVKLLDERFDIIKQIARIKKSLGEPILQPEREKEILSRIRTLSKNPEQAENIFKVIMTESKKAQCKSI